MTASRYASLTDLRDYLSSTGDLGTTQDGLLQDCILDAESAIDTHTRRNFAGTAGSVYVNRFEDYKVVNQALYLDRDLHTLVSITNGDGQVIPVGSVWLEPRNQGPPYRIIRLKSTYAWTWNTDSDVTIAGTFGYGTVPPADIVEATKQLAGYYFRLKDVGPADVAGFQEGGQVSYPKGMPDSIKIILEKYRSRSGGIA